jgi:hypothetical protein
MKKRYQIEQQRAVQQFRRLATEQNPNVQMRQAGLELMHLVMEEEVRHLAGDRHQQHEHRRNGPRSQNPSFPEPSSGHR